jgi:hypothetical protein
MSKLGNRKNFMKKIMHNLFKHYSSVGEKWSLHPLSMITMSGLLLLFYNNCSRSNFSSESQINKNGTSLFQAGAEFSDSGNGGGYNGPHLSFELIPPIDPSEQKDLNSIALRMQTAALICQIGSPNRGILGVFPKIQMQFNGIRITQYCYPNPWAFELFSPVLSELKLLPLTMMAPDFVMDRSAFEKVSAVSILDAEKKEMAYQCISGIIENAFQSNSGGKISANLGSISLSSYDAERDPIDEATSAIGTKYNLKIQYKENFSDNSMILRLVTRDGFPSIIANAHYFNEQNQLIVSPMDYKSRLIPVFPKSFGLKTELFDTVTQTLSPYTFNEFEYMSCLQGEIYRDETPTVEVDQIRDSSGEICGLIAPWVQKLKERKSLHGLSPAPGDLAAVSRSWEDEYEARLQASQNLFSLYLAREINLADLELCLEKVDFKTDFYYTLRSAFYMSTIQKFALTKNSKVKKYLEKLSLFDEKGAWSLFDLRGFNGLTPEESAAGEHRRHQNIFMDFNKIDPKNWAIIFLHETLHRLDDRLLRGSYEFALPETFSRIKNVIQNKIKLDELSDSDRLLIQDWVSYGFDRGLNAEYRAWLKTFQLYQILRSESLINAVDWVDSYINNRITTNDVFGCQLYSELNQNNTKAFSMPELNSPLIQEAIGNYLKTKTQCGTLNHDPNIFE